MQRIAGSRKILIVDDEVRIAETLDLIFSTRGYHVRVAFSAEIAIEVLAEWRPDVAILDVMLPLMNGIDLAIVLRANYPDCHVLLLSGHPGTGELLREASEKGYSFEILAKPLHPAFILDAVSSLLPSGPEPGQA
jgi:DNA-binding response OmpR family regulator